MKSIIRTLKGGANTQGMTDSSRGSGGGFPPIVKCKKQPDSASAQIREYAKLSSSIDYGLLNNLVNTRSREMFVETRDQPKYP